MGASVVVPGQIALLAALVLCASAVRAEVDSFPVERFRPALDRDGIFDVESAAIAPHLNFDAALWANYALNPLVLARNQQRVLSLVQHRVAANVVAQLSLFEWVELGVDVPAVLFQARDTKQLRADVLGAQDLSVLALADLRVSPKIRILREADQFINLALMPSLSIPTASTLAGYGARGYAGEGQVTFTPELLASRSIGAFRLAANVGVRLRPTERKVLNLRVGHELLYRGGAAYALNGLTQIPLELGVTINGGTYLLQPLSSGIEENPLELLAGVSYDVLPFFLQVFGAAGFGIISGFGTPDFRALAGVRLSPRDTHKDTDGDGVEDNIDRCVNDPEDKDGFQDDDGCPDPDNDGDGIVDASDACPNNAEDKDGFEDDNGCPDPDNDGDGVLDADDRCIDVPGPKDFKGCPDKDHDGIADIDDKCPDEPETINGVDDDDGCPDKGKTIVKLTKEKIEIVEKVYFDFDRATIQPRSFTLLDQVFSVLRANPELTRVRVEGHTDDVGDAPYNLQLSQARSDAVRQYLINKGVDVARLQALGFGESRPIDTNTTEAGRELNRRVEFVVAGTSGEAPSATTPINTEQPVAVDPPPTSVSPPATTTTSTPPQGDAPAAAHEVKP